LRLRGSHIKGLRLSLPKEATRVGDEGEKQRKKGREEKILIEADRNGQDLLGPTARHGCVSKPTTQKENIERGTQGGRAPKKNAKNAVARVADRVRGRLEGEGEVKRFTVEKGTFPVKNVCPEAKTPSGKPCSKKELKEELCAERRGSTHGKQHAENGSAASLAR